MGSDMPDVIYISECQDPEKESNRTWGPYSGEYIAEVKYHHDRIVQAKDTRISALEAEVEHYRKLTNQKNASENEYANKCCLLQAAVDGMAAILREAEENFDECIAQERGLYLRISDCLTQHADLIREGE